MADRILFLETPDIPKTPVGEEPTSGSVTSVNGQTGAVVLDADDVGALPANTPIPPAVTEQTVAGWGFTKNTGTYSKPSGGIPKSDLAASVQTSLGKADTALQTAPIQTVKVNGTALVPDANKAVDVTVPTVADVLSETVMIVYLTPTSADLSGTMSKTGSEIIAAYNSGVRVIAVVNGLNGAFEWNQTISGTMVTQFLYGSGGNRELIQVVSGTGSSTSYYAYHIAQLPSVSSADAGKFLRVNSSGAWAAATVQTWQGGSY